MDKRYKPQPLGEALMQRKALVEALTEQAGLSLSIAVRQIRTGLRLTVPEYAKVTGVAERTIYAVESNKGNPSLNTANKLLAPLGFKLGVVPKIFPIVQKNEE